MQGGSSAFSSPKKKITRIGSTSADTVEMDLDITTFCDVNNENVHEFVADKKQVLCSSLFVAFLCRLGIYYTKEVVVISPEFTKKRQEKNDEDISIENFLFGDKNKFETAIIPVRIDNYFAIALYDKGASIMFYDPLYNPIDITIRQQLRSVVSELLKYSTLIRVYQVKFPLFNKAATTDMTSLHCCVIAKLHLFNNRKTYIENISINNERKFIENVLTSIFTGENPFAIEGMQQVELSEYESYKSWEVRRARLNETEEETEERRRTERERRRYFRENQTEEEGNEQRSDEREGRRNTVLRTYHKHRSQARNSTCLLARKFEDNAPIHKLNEMNVECSNCKALHFPEEATRRSKNSFNDCCRYVKISIIFEAFSYS
jgi:hypothetical protein